MRRRASTLVRKASSLQRVRLPPSFAVTKKSRALAAPHLEAFRHTCIQCCSYHRYHLDHTKTKYRLMFPNVAHLTLSITTASEQTPRLAKGPAQVRWGLLRFTLSRMELSFHCIAQPRVPPTQEHQQLPPGEQRQGWLPCLALEGIRTLLETDFS